MGSNSGTAYIQTEAEAISLRAGKRCSGYLTSHALSTGHTLHGHSCTWLQTDGSEPNKLVVMNADVVKVAPPQAVLLLLVLTGANSCLPAAASGFSRYHTEVQPKQQECTDKAIQKYLSPRGGMCMLVKTRGCQRLKFCMHPLHAKDDLTITLSASKDG